MAEPLLPLLEDLREGIHQGIWPSVHPEQVPLWQAGMNCEYRQYGPGKMRGWTNVFSLPEEEPQEPIRGMGQTVTNSGQKLFFGTPKAIYLWNTAVVDIEGSGYTGKEDATVLSPASMWSFANWGQWTLATNGVNKPQLWKGAGFSDLTGVQCDWARIALKRGPHMLLFNTSNGGTRFEWCSEDDIELWLAAAGNSAGGMQIRDLESDIIAAVPLGNRIAVYSKESLSVVHYRGAPFYFGYNPAINGIGAIGVNSVVAVGRFNYGFGLQGFFQTDGGGFEFIDTPHIRDYVMERINWDQASKICGYHDEQAQQIRWFYPANGGLEPNEGVGFDYVRKHWYLYDFGRTAALPRDFFKFVFTANASGLVFFQNIGNDADEEALEAYLETKPLALGSRDYFTFLDQLKVDVGDLSGAVRLQWAGMDRTNAVPQWEDIGFLNEAAEPFDMLRSARYHKFKIISSDLGAAWRIANILPYGKVIGGPR